MDGWGSGGTGCWVWLGRCVCFVIVVNSLVFSGDEAGDGMWGWCDMDAFERMRGLHLFLRVTGHGVTREVLLVRS